jgi:hypothetical protein
MDAIDRGLDLVLHEYEGSLPDAARAALVGRDQAREPAASTDTGPRGPENPGPPRSRTPELDDFPYMAAVIGPSGMLSFILSRIDGQSDDDDGEFLDLEQGPANPEIGKDGRGQRDEYSDSDSGDGDDGDRFRDEDEVQGRGENDHHLYTHGKILLVQGDRAGAVECLGNFLRPRTQKLLGTRYGRGQLYVLGKLYADIDEHEKARGIATMVYREIVVIGSLGSRLLEELVVWLELLASVDDGKEASTADKYAEKIRELRKTAALIDYGGGGYPVGPGPVNGFVGPGVPGE